ncbi:MULTISPECIES: AAA family ATPase [Kocuria]|uniref:AAA family ATPase n=1 Tax=Kocuria TaxID=57493 RepID=UPI0006D7D02B|nr:MULTISPECIES: ATP-binding protein [Kocuria]RUP85032.1 ATP-binding protein [Kocuria sp. HSID17590]RUQ12778.1 ATP-binding protein [Kocuria sp. HSID17582]
MQRSPYTPGEVTTFLPGRETHMRRLRSQMQHVADEGAFIARPRVYVGSRGVGKTSLLRYAQKVARERGLATVWITAGDAGLLPVLSAELQRLTRTWHSSAAQEIAALVRNLEFSLSIPGLGVSSGPGQRPTSVEAPGQALEALIGATASALHKKGGGLAIFIDELQAADRIALKALAYAWQHLRSQEGDDLPATLIAAGLGHTSDVVTDAATFGERFEFIRLKDLSREAAYEALSGPAEGLEVSWHHRAVEAVLDRANGYPHFLQLWAHAAWEAAGSPDPGGTITAGAVEASEDEVLEQLDVFYRTRWGKATPAERDLLRAVAQQTSPTPRRADVAASLGKPTTAISMARRSLMDKGILDSPGRGLLSFTAPGFSEYILEYEGTED